jgi:hypothetical protein
MKAILFLAVLLVAANSSPVHEIFRGFVSSLPMNTEFKNSVINGGLECINSSENVIMRLFMSLQKDINEKHFAQALQEVMVAVDLLEHQIAPQCLMTYQQIVMLFMQRMGAFKLDISNPAAPMLFAGKLIQTFGESVEALAYMRPFNAGEKIANMLMTAFGLMDMGLPKVAQFNYSSFTPFDGERFINKFVPAFLKELGANEYQVNSTTACARDMFNVTKGALINPALHSPDFFVGFPALLEGLMKITDSLNRCNKMVDFSPVQKIFGLFMRYPAQFVMKYYMNDILQKLTVVENEWNFGVHMQHGDYTLAGKALANVIKMELKDIAF